MKVTRILVAVLLLAVVAGAAYAQPQVRMSWNSCDLHNVNQNFGAAGPYKLILSCIGAAGSYSGHDSKVIIRGLLPVPDAWRFDADGCQGGSYIAYSTAGFSKTCAAFQGGNPLGITAYSILENGSAEVRLANSFDAFTAVGANRYTLYQVTFDHTYSVAGAGSPGNTCGGAEVPLNLDSTTEFLLSTGETVVGLGPENRATWNGGVVAAQPSTWGRVKGLYR